MAYADPGRNAELMKRLHRWYIWKKHRGESIQKLFSSTMLHIDLRGLKSKTENTMKSSYLAILPVQGKGIGISILLRVGV